MEALLVHNFEIQSHTGPYKVIFDNDLLNNHKIENLGTHYIIDRNVFKLFSDSMIMALNSKEVVLIDATEETKSYTGIDPIITQLLGHNMKRDSVLVAIGGGITQDIACFIATTFMRGIKWSFIPTTLLAQADSCIGSKSSINFGKYKNLLGSFTPPNEIYVCDKFLNSLEDKDFKSGIGEIVKLLLINGELVSPLEITTENVSEYVYRAMMVKKTYIELDEFDRGVRNILNYGHCFGHGIESATNFAIPHGIAITIGMDIANVLACDEGLITKERYDELHEVLYTIYKDYMNIRFNIADVFAAMSKDKKNTGSKINLILPVGNKMEKRGFENTPAFWDKAKNAMS
jgi:3-dehydroquinate synthase